MKKAITVADIMAWKPCGSYTEERIRKLFGRRKSATVLDILRAPIPAADRLWVVLREDVLSPKVLRLFACKCAERALKRERKAGREPDKRSWDAIVIARRYALGKATAEELSAACSAACSAAWSAAELAAWSAAELAAWSAAELAARSARWSAAWSAAWSVETQWQVKTLLAMLVRGQE